MTRTKTEQTTTVDALTPDPQNRRRHTERNLAMITASLREVGPARSIVIDERDQVLAGNGVLLGAPEAGISKVQIVEVENDTIVAVRRRGLTEEQKRALAIYDNRAAELAEWNAEQLLADADAGLELRPFWTSDEEAALRSMATADTVRAMATAAAPEETDPHAERTEPARDEGYQTFSCPLTLAQERTVRAALRRARETFHVTTTGEALTAALDAWAQATKDTV